MKQAFDEVDELFEEAKKLVSKHNNASAPFIQKELVIGYARTARILDELEEAGIVGPGEGGKVRKVLVKGKNKKNPTKVSRVTKVFFRQKLLKSNNSER